MKTIEAVKLISDENMVLTNGKILAKAIVVPSEKVGEWKEVEINEQMKKRILPSYIQ